MTDDDQRRTQPERSFGERLIDEFGVPWSPAAIDAAGRALTTLLGGDARASGIAQGVLTRLAKELHDGRPTGPARPGWCGECSQGWLGDDAEGRPVPCPRCRPRRAVA